MNIDISFYEANMATMVNDFLNKKVDEDTFCSNFIGLWIAQRDESSKIRDSWDRRYDIEVQEDFLQGKITVDEFRKKYNELFNLTELKNFNETMDRLHGICMCYEPVPESEWEVDEVQFRAEVKSIFENYKLSLEA
jgi:heme oxygenase